MDVHAAEDEQGAIGGGDPLGQEEEVETEPNEEEEDVEDDEEEDEEGQEQKDDLDFDEMIASGHIKLKVRASG